MRDRPLIFLADDDPDDKMLLREALLLLSPDMEIELFDDGRQVIERMLYRISPSLVILDYNMPKMSGLDVLQHVGKSVNDIPFIIWSTSVERDLIKICIQNGAREYFKKPEDSTGFFKVAEAIIKIVEQI